MTNNNQDARPFVDLRKDAEEFQAKFDEDIKECINFLDAKITALICDPDSLGDSVKTVKQNALIEFSKAKYDIFINVKSLINSKEREWLDYISEMKKLFIENVEIFLAGTKLEVKLPSSEFEPSPSPRKSPGNRKSISSMTSSIYPIINNIAKSIPVGSKVQSNRSSRLSIKLSSSPSTSATALLNDNTDSSGSSLDEARTVGDEVQSNRRNRLSIKLNNSPNVTASVYQKQNRISSSESSENEARAVESKVQSNRRGRPSTTSIKLAKSPMLTHEETEDIESDTDEGVVETEDTEMDTDEADPVLPSRKSTSLNQNARMSARGRRGKQSVQNPKLDDDADSLHANSKKLPVRSSKFSEAEKQTTGNARAVNEEEPTVETVSVKTRRGRSAASKTSDESVVARTPARARKGIKILNETYESVSSSKKSNLTSSDEHSEPGTSKSPRKVTFTTEANINDDLDIYSPVARPSKPSARRKTLLSNLKDVPVADIIPGNPTRTKSKRKTIGGVSELESATPSKRLKVSNRKNVSSIQAEDNFANDNLLESDDNYSEWMALKNVDGKIPTVPAIYEVKVWRAKKPAYIGCSENLRQKLTLYKLRQNSGHKHLDKFVERNFDDIQIRFEVTSSVDDAEEEVKNRVSNFMAQYKTTPAYN